MGKRVWKSGTGNYPNNVCNYLLNSSLMYRVRIPSDSRELNILWKDVTKTLPEFVVDVVQLVFEERKTFKQTAKIVKCSPTTVRRLVHRLYSFVNKDGYAMQHMWHWAVEKGYVHTLHRNVLLTTYELFGAKDMTRDDVIDFYDYLVKGFTMHEIHKVMNVRLAVLMRLYDAAMDMEEGVRG